MTRQSFIVGIAIFKRFVSSMEKDFCHKYQLWKLFCRIRNQTAAHAQKGVKCPLSAYEVRSNFGLFERLFKLKKNGIFHFGISFFVLESVLCKWGKRWRRRWFPFRRYNTESIISLDLLTVCSLNLALKIYITIESKWYSSCSCHNNRYAAGPVLIMTKFLRLCITKDHPLPII